MTTRSEIELALDRYLAEGGEQVPDRVIDAALDQIDQLPQRRALRVPWRFHDMATILKPALAGAAVIAVLAVGGTYLGRGEAPGIGAGGTQTPSSTASVTATALPTASPTVDLTDATDWVTVTSEQYGYEIGHPPGWTSEPATRDWSLELDRTNWFGDDVADRFWGYDANRLNILLTAFAVDVPVGMSRDEWIAAYYGEADPGAEPCDTSIDLGQPLLVDGRPARVAVNDGCEHAAFVLIDDRMYVFSVWRSDQEPLFEAFLSTVQFPE
jgi:hypothetical protein